MRSNQMALATSLAPETVEDSVRSILRSGKPKQEQLSGLPKTHGVRRIQRRMGLNQMADISDYARFLRESPDELARLSKDMLIGVTSFFRDPEAFEELRAKVIAPLVEKKPALLPCARGRRVARPERRSTRSPY